MNYLDSEFTLSRDYDCIIPAILAKPHRYIGISSMTMQMQAALDLSKRIKDISPDTTIVWGGHHANIYAEDLLHDHEEIDFCVKGHGERSAELLYHYLEGDVDYDIDSIPGLVYRKDGLIKCNERAHPEKKIYDLQIDYSLIVNFKAVERNFAGEPVREVSIFNSIGCPYRCRFCFNSVEHSTIIFRDLEVVISEIKQVIEKGADCIFFIDELLFIKPERVDRFLDRVREEGLCFSWFAHARTDLINPNKLNKERLRRIREFGCKELHFGIESGSQRMLDYIGKKIKVEDVIPAMRKVLDAGILPKANFIFGMPGETIEDVKRTICLIMDIAEQFEGRVIIMNFFFYPIPGSPMTEESFNGMDIPENVKIRYCLEASRYSVHPNKLFQHFDKNGFYGWIPNKKFFAEVWFLARIISEICLPYKFGKGYSPKFKQWTLEVSQQTQDELLNGGLEGFDTDLVKRWLGKVNDFVRTM